VDESAITGESAPWFGKPEVIDPASREARASSPTRSRSASPRGRRVVSRPHDRPGRRCRQTKNAQRACPHRDVGGAHARLPYGDRSPLADGSLLRRGPSDPDVDRPAGLSHPHHHRRSTRGYRACCMDRALSANVLAKSGKRWNWPATSTRCFWIRPVPSRMGDRQATEYHPLPGVTREEVAEAAMCASFGDQTPEVNPSCGLERRPLDPARRANRRKPRSSPFGAHTIERP